MRVIGLSPSFDFWNIPEDALNNQVDSVVWTTAVGFPASVTVKLRARTAAGRTYTAQRIYRTCATRPLAGAPATLYLRAAV